MQDSDVSESTLLLTRATRGNKEAERELVPLVYGRLREIAAAQLSRERPDHTLQPTALVHEAYLRLVEQSMVDWKDRSFFLGVAAREMRRVLIDHARGRKRAKRGGGWGRVLLEQVAIPSEGLSIDVLDVDAAVKDLAAFDERLGRVVELRFFAGLTVEEVARVLELSPKTVEKDWRLARAWLYRSLRDERDRNEKDS